MLGKAWFHSEICISASCHCIRVAHCSVLDERLYSTTSAVWTQPYFGDSVSHLRSFAPSAFVLLWLLLNTFSLAYALYPFHPSELSVISRALTSFKLLPSLLLCLNHSHQVPLHILPRPALFFKYLYAWPFVIPCKWSKKKKKEPGKEMKVCVFNGLTYLLSFLPGTFRVMACERSNGGRASSLSSMCCSSNGFLLLVVLRWLTGVTIFSAWYAWNLLLPKRPEIISEAQF